MSTKVKGEAIKEGSIPLSALATEVKDKIENASIGADWNAPTYKEGHIKNRTHHMQDYMCHYFKGSPIKVSKPSGTGYVLLTYDTDLADKFIRIEIKADESKTYEFLDAMGMPLIFTWDAGNSTINVESFMGAVDIYGMRAYYSSSAKSYDEYFVTLDDGFIPESVARKSEIAPALDNKADKIKFEDKSYVDTDGISTHDFYYSMPNSANGTEDDIIATKSYLKKINGQDLYGKGNIEIKEITPDWLAQKGELGYIENRPFGFDDFKEVEWYISEYGEYYYCTEVSNQIKINGIVYDISEDITDINGVGVKIAEDGIRVYGAFDGYFIKSILVKVESKIDEKYLPNTVLKTTPQTLSDVDKNQALTNLGIDPVVWKYICRPLPINDQDYCPEELLDEQGNLKYQIPSMYIVHYNGEYCAPISWIDERNIRTFYNNGSYFEVNLNNNGEFTITEMTN